MRATDSRGDSANLSLDAQTSSCIADGLSRRHALVAGVASLALGLGVSGARAEGIEQLNDVPGVGTRGARKGDLVMFHYVGKLEATGEVFDSTRGGLKYRDGGMGVLRPAAVALGGGPIPGICVGLQEALVGMSIGGKRTVRVPPELGFGRATVLAPYAVVPGESTLVYEVELLRLSAQGPDQLTSGIAFCGAGGQSEQSSNCGDISIAEFL